VNYNDITSLHKWDELKLAMGAQYDGYLFGIPVTVINSLPEGYVCWVTEE
jgi:hypothetical protein